MISRKTGPNLKNCMEPEKSLDWCLKTNDFVLTFLSCIEHFKTSYVWNYFLIFLWWLLGMFMFKFKFMFMLTHLSHMSRHLKYLKKCFENYQRLKELTNLDGSKSNDALNITCFHIIPSDMKNFKNNWANCPEPSSSVWKKRRN